MKPQNHTTWSATAAIAAALALSATPLAAQSVDAPVTAPPAMQSQPVAPAPAVTTPDVTAEQAVTPDEPLPEPADTVAPAASGASDSVAPATTRSTRQTTTTRTTTSSRTVAPAVVAAPVVVPPPAPSDIAPLPDTAETTATTTTVVPPPTPTQSNNVIGTLGVILLGLLALAVLAAGLLFFRRRHPVVTETVEETTAPEPVAQAPVAAPTVPVTPMVATATLRHRDPNPVAGALPSDGASVDLPAKLPEGYEERAALLNRMVEAKPDKANPFTDRRQRLRRARLIMQSIGRKFDREPMIDLSQYPNNWPELARQYHKAA